MGANHVEWNVASIAARGLYPVAGPVDGPQHRGTDFLRWCVMFRYLWRELDPYMYYATGRERVHAVTVTVLLTLVGML